MKRKNKIKSTINDLDSSALHETLADKAFIATDGLISQSFVVTFVHPIHMQIVLIWEFPAQLIL